MNHGLFGYLWLSMVMLGYPWLSMDIYGYPWLSLVFYGFSCVLIYTYLVFFSCVISVEASVKTSARRQDPAF